MISPTIRTLLATALVATFVSPVFAQNKVTITPVVTVDTAYKHTARITLEVAGMEAILTTLLDTKVTAINGEEVSTKTEFKDFKVDLGGSDPGVPVTDLVIKGTKQGAVTKVDGGISAADNTRIALLLRFIAPTTEVTQDGTYTVNLPENREGMVPAITVSGKYLGPETVNGIAGHKFEQKVTESGPDGMTGTSVFVVKEDGTILSIKGTFKNLPVPALGVFANGSVEAKIAS